MLKPKSKETASSPESKRKSAGQAAGKVSKPAAPAVSRKVATVANHSPTKPLRRSNTMPVKKSEPKTNPVLKKQPTHTGTSVAGSKPKVVSSSSNHKVSTDSTVQNITPNGVIQSNSSPTKYTTRPASAMDTSTSMIAKPSSPRKKTSLSPRKPVAAPGVRHPAIPTLTSPAGISPKKSVDSSFHTNIKERIQKEPIETEELQVCIAQILC